MKDMYLKPPSNIAQKKKKQPPQKKIHLPEKVPPPPQKKKRETFQISKLVEFHRLFSGGVSLLPSYYGNHPFKTRIPFTDLWPKCVILLPHFPPTRLSNPNTSKMGKMTKVLEELHLKGVFRSFSASFKLRGNVFRWHNPMWIQSPNLMSWFHGS